jgi:hypothetical protein
MCAAGGGYRSPVTSEDGYQLRLTPNCLRINVDHRPVIHRLQQGLPTEADKSSGASTGPPSVTWERLRGQLCSSALPDKLGPNAHWRKYGDRQWTHDYDTSKDTSLHYHPQSRRPIATPADAVAQSEPPNLIRSPHLSLLTLRYSGCIGKTIKSILCAVRISSTVVAYP